MGPMSSQGPHEGKKEAAGPAAERREDAVLLALLTKGSRAGHRWPLQAETAGTQTVPERRDAACRRGFYLSKMHVGHLTSKTAR